VLVILFAFITLVTWPIIIPHQHTRCSDIWFSV